MLVVSMKHRDRTFVYDTESDRVAIVQVADIQRGKVRLGFHAGPAVRFWRESVLSPQQVRDFEDKLARQGG